MKYKLLIILCLFAMNAFAQNIGILPSPQQVETHEGQFVWNDDVILTYDATDAEISQIISMWRSDLDQIIGRKMMFARGNISGKRYIELTKTDHLGVSENEDQAYRLTIRRNSIRMEATTSSGLPHRLCQFPCASGEW